jgi:hypothetical protein
MKRSTHRGSFSASLYGFLGLPILLVVAITFGRANGASSPTADSANGPLLIRDAQLLSVTYQGPQVAVQALESGVARPLSLTRGDFDGNGIADLLAGYAASDGSGIVVLHKGNLDAFAPQSNSSWQAIAERRFVEPFLSPATVFQVPRPPDFLAAGYFGNDHLDVLTAARGDSALYLLAGNGHGDFAAPQVVPVAGTIAAMATGKFGRGNLASKVFVGTGAPNPAVLVYSATQGAWSLEAQFPLSFPATGFAAADMDGDGLSDVVILAGGQIAILHAAWGASGKPGLETISLPSSAVAMTAGFFIHDRGWRQQLAVLDQKGTVNIVAHGEFDSRGWTLEEVKAMRDALRHRQPNPFRRKETGPARDGWKVVEALPGMSSYPDTGPAPVLLSSRISGGVTEDVLVLDPASAQIAVATHAPVRGGLASFVPARVANRPYAGGAPVKALSFPVNADAREGLIVFQAHDSALWAMMPISLGDSTAAQPLQGAR